MAGLLAGMWEAFWGWLPQLQLLFVSFLINRIPDAAFDMLPFDNQQSLLLFLRAVSFYIPVFEMVNVISVTAGAVWTIRLVRWLFACIPTLGG